MNKCILCGRLVKDPQTTQRNETTITRFTIAVDRRTKDKQTDFPSCVAFNKTAESITKWCKKGTKILIEGRIQTGSYTNKDNVKVYTTDVIVDSWEFAESKNSAPEAASNGTAMGTNNFMSIPDGIDEELPFN